ncbi:uncharacterized protein EV154DRAFT_571743 [Mucor mucedo]|uniref:uncharacterized protein n=1 Tax=Mucor mucedo TaxID=29922 RepID=UPI00221FE211|nr:uncharacterized protein EV154DRAFT_571743 [Mucor mucedo]KAI7867216.1 hypothetical protein EV154DRAFT_571743 [Mucor mucedo]
MKVAQVYGNELANYYENEISPVYGSKKRKTHSKRLIKTLYEASDSRPPDNINAIYGDKSSRNIKKRSLDSAVEESTNFYEIFGVDKDANNHRIEEKNKMEDGITAFFSTYDDDLPYKLNDRQHNGDYELTSDGDYNFTGQLNVDLKNRIFGGFVVRDAAEEIMGYACDYCSTPLSDENIKKDDDSSSVCSMNSLNIRRTLEGFVDEGWLDVEEVKFCKFTASPDLDDNKSVSSVGSLDFDKIWQGYSSRSI